MSFELLDALLTESGHAPTGMGRTEGKYETIQEDSDSEIFSDLDGLVESAMRETLRSTILESSIPDQTKIEHISVVEEAEFTPEQMYTFMQENIQPVLDMSGVLEEGFEFTSKTTALSLPVYESALAIWLHKNGQLQETISEMVAENELIESGHSISEAVSMVEQSSKDKSSSIYSQLISERTTSESSDLISDVLSGIMEKYEIEVDKMNDIVNEAETALQTAGVENLIVDIQEMANLVATYNIISESDGGGSFSDWLYEAERDSSGKMVFGKKAAGARKTKTTLSGENPTEFKYKDRDPIEAKKSAKETDKSTLTGEQNKKYDKAPSAKKAIGLEKKTGTGYYLKKGRYKDAALNIKNKFKGAVRNTGKLLSKAGSAIGKAAKSKYGKIGGAAVGAAAVAAAGVAGYKAYKNRQCGGLDGAELAKCKKTAAAQGLRAAQASMSSCKTASNPERCAKSAQKEVEKWKARVAKY